jgi:hypothetical protein
MDESEPAADFDLGLLHARDLLARLYSRNGGDPLGLPEPEPASCDDCQRPARRYTYGRLRLCRGCTASRYRAALQLGRRPPPPAEHQEVHRDRDDHTATRARPAARTTF